jgi:hypothetical protein
MTMDYLSTDKSFNMLSVKDLIEARDLYHVHLMHKENVIATAVGRYRIRSSDPWPDEKNPYGTKGPMNKEPRTLLNSEVRVYSWPCVLVFVERWVPLKDFGDPNGPHADRVVPRALYMPDGRVVPVCVIEARKDEIAPGPVRNLAFPQNLIGGGYPVLAEVQGDEHVASIGCLVSDGHYVYALTNRHVVGEPGEPVYSILGGRKVALGESTPKQETRVPFEELYPHWPGKNVYVNMDVGLIKVEEKDRWTAQIFGIGTMGNLADLSEENISLKLIGCPVRAFGCASREMWGEIQGLFYRFKSVGGFEYVSDFLIGPRKDKPFHTHPGDSGTIWLLETDNKKTGLMPIAVQWGGQVFIEDGEAEGLPYALATSLSTVCDRLQVDLIRDWNIGQPEYWGAVGHYTIANKACDAVVNANLKKLMNANLDNITFPQPQITKKGLSGLSKHHFVPLADVPDLAWKLGKGNRGQPEHPNHFADMDKPDLKQHKTTLLKICESDTANVSIPVWQKYYKEVGDKSQGLLPFRVWQFFEAMVNFAKAGDVTQFVCAAGILSHYVGDACQPLHISYMFDGDPDDKVHNGHGVHAAYEDGMVDSHTPEIMAGVDKQLGGRLDLPDVNDGPSAAVAVVDLMQKTFATIQPGDIVDAFVKVKDQKPRAISDALWSQFGDDTIKVMTYGSRYLAHLWDAAWKQGDGDKHIGKLGKIDPEALIKLYTNHDFLPSKTLDHIGPLLQGSGVQGNGAAASNGRATTGRKTRGGAAPRRTRSKPRPKAARRRKS